MGGTEVLAIAGTRKHCICCGNIISSKLGNVFRRQNLCLESNKCFDSSDQPCFQEHPEQLYPWDDLPAETGQQWDVLN